jgi:hypothetical protein
MTMRIYVGTYAKYNDGNLFGTKGNYNGSDSVVQVRYKEGR